MVKNSNVEAKTSAVKKLRTIQITQSKRLALEEVLQPKSNTNLRVPDPLNVKDEEYDTKYGFTEDQDKSFDGDSAKS